MLGRKRDGRVTLGVRLNEFIVTVQ